MERGYNEGRLAARCEFIIEDLKMDGIVDTDVVDAILEAGGNVNCFDDDEPELRIRHSGCDDDVMPRDLCDYVDLPQGSTYKEGREALSDTVRSDFDGEANLGEVAADLAPSLAKHGLRLEAVEELDKALSAGDEAKAWAAGAIDAFTLNLLHEFSASGGDGVVEIRIVDGVPQGVYVRSITEAEKSVPKNERGKIANWEVSTEGLARLFVSGNS
jgi:hypothetical protein